MNPDLLVELAVDLVVSYVTGNDIVLGRRRWAARDVALMLEALGIYQLPCSNPDGREYVMTVEWDWRKNRRVDPESSCIGVDLNPIADPSYQEYMPARYLQRFQEDVPELARSWPQRPNTGHFLKVSLAFSPVCLNLGLGRI